MSNSHGHAVHCAKALQYLAPGEVRLVEVETGMPGPGRVAIRILASALCNHSELRSFHGGSSQGYGSRYPMLPGEPGHEGVGRITDLGPGVEGLAVGDLVVLTGIGGEPAHRSHLLRDAGAVASILPEGRDPKAACTLEMFGCAYHCVRAGWTLAGGYDHRRVAVIGAGAIGLCSLQILRLWPARELVVLDVSAAKLELAGRLGATETVAVPADAAAQALAKTLGRFDVVVECSGHVNGHALASALAPRALINVSYCPTPFAVDQGAWFAANTTVFNPGIVTTDELRAVADLYNRHLLDPDALVSCRISPDPEQYVQTIAAIRRGEIIKAVIDWEAA